MIKTLKRAVSAWPEPKWVTVKTWRDDATNGRVSLHAKQRINVAHPKARFAALESQPPFDEILISTLPTAISRWLDMALPDRIGKLTDAKISIIHADDQPAYT